MLELNSKRLDFVRYNKNDLENVIRLVSNEAVMRYIGEGTVKDRDYAKQLIERMEQQYKNFGDYGLHKLIDRNTGQFIGHAGLVAQIIDDAFEMELGYWILPNYWGQGYGFEAAQALAQYADEEMYLERYVSAIQVDNVASEKIALKNGMHLEKTITMEGKLVNIFVKINEFEDEA